MSSQVIWNCIKKNNCYLHKSNGIILSTDPTNMCGIHNERYSGLSNIKSAGIVVKKPKNVEGTKQKSVQFVLVTKCAKPAVARKLYKSVVKTKISKNIKCASKKIEKILNQYRPDLVPLAQKKYARLMSTFKKPYPVTPRKNRH
eukprot:GHVL01037802.1.p1 GENE.GHVL01037802.1~~GHVL01037802.1.p1  ORF type:complete len:144 (+),score=27.52 GHVL01037802.1:15-446(+)